MGLKRRSAAVMGTVVALLVAGGCGSSKPAHSSAAQAGPSSAHGSPINVGMIVDLTGPGASTYAVAVKGAEARIGLQNAEGGVDGHPLKLYTVDDAGSATQAATAAQELVTEHDPLAVIADSDVTFGAAKYLHSVGEPVFGDGEDGPEWGTQPYTNMFSYWGEFNPVTDDDDTTYVDQFLKNQGATNVAELGYGTFPTSVAFVIYHTKAAEQLGMKVGLEDKSIPFPGMNATATALAMKAAGVNAMDPGIQTSDALNLLIAVSQTGQKLKVPYLSTAYGQEFLDQPSAVAAGQGAYFLAFQRPIEEKTPATIKEVNALKKYAGYSGDPSINLVFGWTNADLAITGVEAAGPNPTKSGVINAIHTKVKNWTAGGLLAVPRDFSLADFGQSPQKQCGFFVQLRGHAFFPVPANGAPTCGTKVS